MNKLKCFLLIMGIVISCKDNQPTIAYNPHNEWRTYASDNKFSSLDILNTSNVRGLEEVWRFEDPKIGSGISCNPLVAKGRMFVYTPAKTIASLNPKDGSLLWEFTPDSTRIPTSRMRGMTFYDGKGKEPDAVMFVHGSTLYKLNTVDGTPYPNFGSNGRVDFYTGLEIDNSMIKLIDVTSHAPGVVYKDLFIIGCMVPDELPSVPGDIRGFNVHSGKLEWIFHTIPKEGEYGADTWPKNARKTNGGANCWGGMSLDKKRGIVYVPTASPSFDFYGADREGQNLFANCLLALDAQTGKRLWHFQTTHHDLWDRDNGSPPNLVTVMHEGKKVDAVALATKLGYVFLFDRDTGKPLFPIEEVPVPTEGGLPGEKPWPTQPIPQKPEPFARQGFKEEYYSDVSEGNAERIKKDIAKNHYNTGIYEPPSESGSIVLPAAHGGSNWGGASLNPNTGIMFVNAVDMPWFVKMIDLGKKATVDESLKDSELFKMYCSSCHGMDKKGTDYGPNIVVRGASIPFQEFNDLLIKGREPMPAFKQLSQDQRNAIMTFVKGLSEKESAEHNQKIDKEATAVAQPYTFSGYGFYNDADGYPAIKPPWGTLTAIDLNRGELLWQVPLGQNETLEKKGIHGTGTFNRGGGIATAGGLIFIAATSDKKFRAFDQKTGEVVWETQLPGTGQAIPCTYAIDGKQYVTIAVNPDPEIEFNGGYITYALK